MAKKKAREPEVVWSAWPVDSRGAGRPRITAPPAPIEAMLALDRVILAAYADGRVGVLPVGPDVAPRLLGEAWELARLAPHALALAFACGEVLAASGARLARIRPDGELLPPIDLGAPITALASRSGRVVAAAGGALHLLERTGETWTLAARIPLPFAGARDVDLDASGALAVVVDADPAVVRAKVIAIPSGDVVGTIKPSAVVARAAREVDARFDRETDDLLVAYSRAHHVQRVSRRGTSIGGWKRELDQPSAWCTPLAVSVDRRWLAARQSGVGVIVWDLATEQIALFAELDEGPAEGKFAKLARVMPVSAKQTAPGAVRLTRWKSAPELEGETTAIAVGPGGAYAAAAMKDGTITVIDRSTRRIEQSDGRLVQDACVTHVVRMGADTTPVEGEGEIFLPRDDGTLQALDLTSGEVREVGRFGKLVSATPLGLVFEGGGVWRCLDRATLRAVWATAAPLAHCGSRATNGQAIVGLEQRGDACLLHRLDPVTGVASAPVPVDLAATRFRQVEPLEIAARGDRLALSGWCHDGQSRTHALRSDGTVGAGVEAGTLMADLEHVFDSNSNGWKLSHIDQPFDPLAEARIAKMSVGFSHADVRLDRVVTGDMATWRVHVLTLRGELLKSFDALGPVVAGFFFAPGGEAVWITTRDGARTRVRLN